MTVPSTARRAGPFLGNGVTTTFSFSFKTFAAGDLVVTRTASNGVETTLVLNSDYSVSLNSDQDASPGGTITYPLSGSPLAAGQKLTIVGDLDYEQTTDLLGGGAFNARVIEDTFDRTVIQIQQLEERLDRALVAPVSDTPVDMTMPTAANRANRYLSFDATGKPISTTFDIDAVQNASTAAVAAAAAAAASQVAAASSQAVAQTQATFVANTVAATTPTVVNFSGDGAAVAFTLPSAPGAEENTLVFIGGVYQQKSEYSVSGTTLTFTSAPPAGTNNIEVQIGPATNIAVSSSLGVSFLQAGAGAVTRTAQSKLRDVVSVFDFMTSAQVADVQARTALVDVTTAIQNAFNSLGNGGEVFFPAGVYKISSMVTMPIGSTLSGSGMTREGSSGVTQGGTVIYQSGAAFALKANKLCNIRDVSVWGRLGLGSSGSVATGGIFWENAAFGTMTNVAVEYFPALNAVAIKVHECYRLQFNYVHIFSVYHGLQTTGNVTTFQWNKGNVARTNDFNVGTGRALDFSGGSSNNTEIEFNGVYFESCFGANPIYADQSTRIKFDFCGFEAMCVNESYAGTVTNPIVINMVNPAVCDITNCQWSGWYTPGQTFAGTLKFLRARGSGYTISGSKFEQNFSLGGLSAVCVDTQDFVTRLTITNNTVLGAGFTTELAAKRWLLSNAETYPSRNFTAFGNKFKGASDPVSVFSAADVFPVGNNSAPAGVVPVTVTGTATTIVYSTTVPRELLRSGHGLKLRAWGRRTGTVGSKQATLLITDTGAATSINITGAITAANSWGSNIVIYCRDNASQSVNAQSIDGSTALNISQTLSEDFAANDMLLELQLAVATAAETMTLDGLVLEAF